MTRAFLLPALAVVAAIVMPGRRRRAEEYVGLDHPSGEMRLTLAPAGEFRLSLAIRDPVVGTLVRTSEVTGRWRRTHRLLELRSSNRHLVYRGVTHGEARWIWQRSNLPTFADGIPLVLAPR